MRKFLICFFCLILSLSFFASCNGKGNDDNITSEPNYVNTTVGNAPTQYHGIINVDESWKTNYVLQYSFYDFQGGTSSISECCNETGYVSIDNETGIVTYVQESEGFLLQYFLDPPVLQGTMSVITGNSLSDLQSGFYLLSVVDRRLPAYSNTTLSGKTTVAGRSATQYIQTGITQNSNENLTALIYVDDQYGFVSKCELFNSSRTLMMKWELTSFSSNREDVLKAMPKIDLTDYQIASSVQ